MSLPPVIPTSSRSSMTTVVAILSSVVIATRPPLYVNSRFPHCACALHGLPPIQRKCLVLGVAGRTLGRRWRGGRVDSVGGVWFCASMGTSIPRASSPSSVIGSTYLKSRGSSTSRRAAFGVGKTSHPFSFHRAPFEPTSFRCSTHPALESLDPTSTLRRFPVYSRLADVDDADVWVSNER